MNNYKDFLALLNNLKANDEKPTLLLHSCCAPCSTYVIDKLYPYFKITILYYNPNIYPFDEYQKRLDYQKKLLLHYKDISIIEGDYDYNFYLENIDEFKELKEKSIRCYHCYEMRIKYLSKVANEMNFSYFTTTLSVSPYKISKWINELGFKYESKSKYLYSDFKKEDGYKKSIILSKKYNIYRQEYCGCDMSLEEKKKAN